MPLFDYGREAEEYLKEKERMGVVHVGVSGRVAHILESYAAQYLSYAPPCTGLTFFQSAFGFTSNVVYPEVHCIAEKHQRSFNLTLLSQCKPSGACVFVGQYYYNTERNIQHFPLHPHDEVNALLWWEDRWLEVEASWQIDLTTTCGPSPSGTPTSKRRNR